MKTRGRRALAIALFGCCFGLTACDRFPDDVEGTMQHVINSGKLRAGIVEGVKKRSGEVEMAQELAAAFDAKAFLVPGSEEELMNALEHGKLDIVVGNFARNSPWSKRVTITSPYQTKEPPKEEPVLRAALRNGENRWFMHLEEIVHRRPA